VTAFVEFEVVGSPAARRPMTTLEVADAIRVQPQTASKALQRLAQAGAVTPDGHGHYQLTKEHAT